MYGLFVGCQIKGYMACLLCSPNVDARLSSQLKKMCTKDIAITLEGTTHIGETMLPSMD
jgi:hypothetical protein